VHVDDVTDASVQGWHSERLPVVGERQVAHQCGIQDRVDAGSVVRTPVPLSAYPRAG